MAALRVLLVEDLVFEEDSVSDLTFYFGLLPRDHR